VGRSGLRQAFDDLDELVAAVACWRVSRTSSRAWVSTAPLRGPGHGDAVAALELQQSFVAEQPQGSQDGVAVHPEHGGQVACGRQPFAG
jgi:hypothetical protein